MITLNEKNLGNFAPEQAQAAVAYLQGKGYDCTYGEFAGHGVAKGVVSRHHWNQAQNVAATTPALRNLEDLPYAEQITLLQEMISYISDKYLCPALFGEAAQ